MWLLQLGHNRYNRFYFQANCKHNINLKLEKSKAYGEADPKNILIKSGTKIRNYVTIDEGFSDIFQILKNFALRPVCGY